MNKIIFKQLTIEEGLNLMRNSRREEVYRKMILRDYNKIVIIEEDPNLMN